MISYLKKQEADDILKKRKRTQTMQMILRFLQIHPAKPNPNFISGSKQLEIQLKQTSYFKQEGAISLLIVKPQKLVEQLRYPGNNISSTESDIS